MAIFVIFLLQLGCVMSSANYSENYDFIIVGGGTAGLAVARRLAQGGKHSVLVLESGGLPKEGQDVPAFAPTFLGDFDVTFQYLSTPQKNAGLKNEPPGVLSIFSGRTLSGTSNLNYMVWNRGHPRDYDNWARITQDDSWSYANMLKYFKRSEHYAGDFFSAQHGFGGPVTVSRPRYSPGLKEWLEAGKSLGYPILDPNGPQQKSFTPMEFSKKKGRRNAAFVAYIQPILAVTPKLKIILNTNVTKIIFEGKRAIGVCFQSQAPELQAIKCNCLDANKEIIISAGVYGSPQILMRSGIGPKSVLIPSGIPLKKELPVGQSFMDHVATAIPMIINNRALVEDEQRDLNPATWKMYNEIGDGPYSCTQGFTGQAFLVSPDAVSDGEQDWPDVQLTMWHSIEAFRDAGYMAVNDSSILPSEAPMTVTVFLVRPKSRGTITLNSRDPNGLPVLNMGYLDDPRDIEKCLHGVKEIVRIMEDTPAYRKLGARFPFIDIPMCRPFPFKSDDYWRCFIRSESHTGCHPASSCRMGRGENDPDAVVDTRLKVIGVNNLRVVDASIMPVVTNANTHAAVYGIAEKASEMILEEWSDTYDYGGYPKNNSCNK